MSGRFQGVLDANAARDAGDVDALVELLNGGDQLGRRSAALALGDMRAGRAVKPLIRCLAVNDEVLRIAAIKALGKIGDPTASEDVFDSAARDQPFGVRTTAAEALVRLGDPRAGEILGSVAVDADGMFRRSAPRWAAKLLVEIAYVPAIPQLREAARRSGLLTKIRLRRAIRQLERIQASRSP